MSHITVAKNAGFCPGVRAAVAALEQRLQNAAPGERLCTLGNLIHNDDYCRDLAARGVTAVSEAELPALAGSADDAHPVTVVIRAHGVTRETEALLGRLAAEHSGFSYVDATCPFVRKIHRIAEEQSAAGDRVFLCIGNENHPEVAGFMSRFDGEKYVFADAAAFGAALDGGLAAVF